MSGLPAGLALVQNANGVYTITGTPYPDTGGVYSTANGDAIIITASNGSGPDFMQQFTLTVNQPAAFLGANTPISS